MYLFCSVKDWGDTKFGSRECDNCAGQARVAKPGPVSCRKKKISGKANRSVLHAAGKEKPKASWQWAFQ